MDNSVQKDKAGTANEPCGERALGCFCEIEHGLGPSGSAAPPRHVSAADSALFSMIFGYLLSLAGYRLYVGPNFKK